MLPPSSWVKSPNLSITFLHHEAYATSPESLESLIDSTSLPYILCFHICRILGKTWGHTQTNSPAFHLSDNTCPGYSARHWDTPMAEGHKNMRRNTWRNSCFWDSYLPTINERTHHISTIKKVNVAYHISSTTIYSFQGSTLRKGIWASLS